MFNLFKNKRVEEPTQPVSTLGNWCEASGMVRLAKGKRLVGSLEKCPRCGRLIYCGIEGRFRPHHATTPKQKTP
jgi:hypothetical protein